MFNNIVDVIKNLTPNHPLCGVLINNSIFFKRTNVLPFMTENGKLITISDPYCYSFYRGENELYSECKSSLHRIQLKEQQILELAKTFEFISFIESLPEVTYFSTYNDFDPWAIAQHYGFATPMIDLTSEIAVAAFFATHKFDFVTKRFEIIKEGIGRIRYINVNNFCKSIRPIGIQPYCRPSNQYGWGYWCDTSTDFATISDFVEFQQDIEVNTRLDHALGEPALYLFPDEKICYEAYSIKNGNVITNKAVECLIQAIQKDSLLSNFSKDKIYSVLEQNKYFIVDAPVAYPLLAIQQHSFFRNRKSIVIKPIFDKNSFN